MRPATTSLEFRDTGPVVNGTSGHGFETIVPKDGGPTEIRCLFYVQGVLTAFKVTLQPASEAGTMTATVSPWTPPETQLPVTRDGLKFTQVPLESYPSGVLLKAEDRMTLSWSNTQGERRLLEGTLHVDPPMSEEEYRKLRLQRSGVQVPQ